MPLRVYMDMDSLDSNVVEALRAAGIDVLTTPEAGNERASDEDQLAFATAEGRVIYTANRADYSRLHAALMRAGGRHVGIIVRARQQTSIGKQIRGLGRICQAYEAEGLANLLVYLENRV